ncbi:MAG: DUF3524 domain-containing protein [Deltaproteobacteria bacterium]|nr:DUF3524 domain-containing protein [Deltaproteobacteria bacterium]MBN2673142.1 DUF3524 domain-containing protein [Deltaproteobacteria bacterium]
MNALRIAYLEPFYGGSHKRFVDGLISYSRHSLELFSLPDRFWKWRTRGAAPAFYNMLSVPEAYDLIVASDMVNLAELQGLWKTEVPLVQYMHENQLTYPLEDGSEPDANYVMTDLLSMLAADRVVFNTNFHRTALLQAADAFVLRLPDFKPGWIVSRLAEKSEVLYPGVQLSDRVAAARANERSPHAGPVLLWNHRWEYDKQPNVFLALLRLLRKQGTPFLLLLLGDRATVPHSDMIRIEQEFPLQIVFSGYAESSIAYERWLSRADIAFSAAIQENFGIAAVEAMSAGCAPLFPRRLAYPEIVPASWQERGLYDGLEDAAARIAAWTPLDDSERGELHHHCRQFSMNHLASRYDALFERMAVGKAGARRR